jgi:hypothetical protein
VVLRAQAGGLFGVEWEYVAARRWIAASHAVAKAARGRAIPKRSCARDGLIESTAFVPSGACSRGTRASDSYITGGEEGHPVRERTLQHSIAIVAE